MGPTKVCKRCERELAVAEFAVDRSRPGGRYYLCKECKRADDKARREDPVRGEALRARNRQWHEKNPERSAAIRRRKWIKERFGLTPEEYDSLIASAAGCEICGSAGPLVLDHCHNSGAIRGVLCQPCNRGLGQFRDDALLLEEARTYLVRRSGLVAA